jgi:predicted transcriptional regulator of viral defense system
MSRSSIENNQILFEIAESQYGLFTAKQAIEAGFKKNNHPYHVRAGNWVREWHGIYRLVRFPLHKDSELALWLLWAHDRSSKPQGVYSHETALRIFDISDLMPAKLHLTVPKDFRKHPPKSIVLHKGAVPEQDITVTEDLRVTTPLRTILDLITTNTVSWDILRQALSESLQQGLIMQHQIKKIKNNNRLKSLPIQKLLELLKEIE